MYCLCTLWPRAGTGRRKTRHVSGSTFRKPETSEWNSEPLAAMFLIISDKRNSYLYGASAAKHRNVMATYALQWEAIQLAKAKNCTEYDMFGTSPTPDPTHPMYGLYKFKSGFGGNLFHSLGCWDYPLLQKPYEMYKAFESQAAGFHMSRQLCSIQSK